MKKKNLFRIYLENKHPLQDEVYFSQRYDMAIYKTLHFTRDWEKVTHGHPMGDIPKRATYYEKCLRHTKQNEPNKIREFLLYDLTYEQGMIMVHRPSLLQRKWCLAIVKMLPFRKMIVASSEYPDMKRMDLKKRLINASQQPMEALEYVLSLFDQGKLKEAYNKVYDHIWDTYVLSGDDLKIVIENNRVKSVCSNQTFRSLRLIEV